MLRISNISQSLGIVARSFALLMTIPLAVALLFRQADATLALGVCSALALLVAKIMRRLPAGSQLDDLNRIEGMAIVSLSWLMVTLLGSVPYLFFGFSLIDAFFESMSGYTATGATILDDFGRLNSAMFFYRSFTQWLGGMGILVLFVAILPRLAISGRQLFFAETSGAGKEKLTPHIRDTARQLWAWYLVLTLVEAALLFWLGMPLWEAFANTFSTISAAGFSPHPQSIMGYQSAKIEWVLIFFMFLAGANFTLQVKCLRGNFRSFLGNSELRLYLLIIAIATLLLMPQLLISQQHSGNWLDTLRVALFQNVSIITSTGVATVDFDTWGAGAKVILLLLMLVGGCSGSACGGIKVVRFLLLLRYLGRVLVKVANPHAVIQVKLRDRFLKENEIQPILSFVVIYGALLVGAGTLVAILENDLLIGYVGSISSLGNVGPGLGKIGPMGSYCELLWPSKLVFALLMWAGRLEILTLAVFLRLEVWRDARW